MKKLRGTMWKPGVNGLGVGPVWMRRLLPYRWQFDAAGREHDKWYDIGGESYARLMYDLRFFADMVSWCENWKQLLMAHVYFIAVRMFGWAFFRYH